MLIFGIVISTNARTVVYDFDVNLSVNVGDGSGSLNAHLGDLINGGQVDMCCDMAELSQGWQSIYTLNDLVNIAEDWFK